MVPVSTRRPARAPRGLAVAALAACLSVLAAPPARAQSIWLDRDHRWSAGGEVLFPSFVHGDTQFPDWTWYASGRVPLGEFVHVVGELPYTAMNLENGFAHASTGNPYLGIEYARGESGPWIELGGRAPVVRDDAESPFLNGYLTDLDRTEAFAPDVLALRLGVHLRGAAPAAGGLGYDFRLVPAVWIPTEKTFLLTNQTFLGYGVVLRYVGDAVRAGGGLTGRWNVTNADQGFGETTQHQAEFAADFLRGRVRPGLELKLPLDHDLRQLVQQSWGVTLSVLPGWGL